MTVHLQQQADYRFDIRFDDTMPVLTGDEPAPLGTGLGPSPVQLLCAAVGNCLSDSLLFAFRKFKQFCTGTQSAGQGIPIHTRVMDAQGVI